MIDSRRDPVAAVSQEWPFGLTHHGCRLLVSEEGDGIRTADVQLGKRLEHSRKRRLEEALRRLPHGSDQLGAV